MIEGLCSYSSNPTFLGIFDFNNAGITIFIFYGYIVSILFSLILLIFAGVRFFKNKTTLSYSFIALTASYLLLSINELVLWTAGPHFILKAAWFLVFPTEFLFMLSLGYVCFSILKPVFNGVIFHTHIRLALLAAAFTPLWVNIKSYDPVECNGISGPLSYVFYVLKFLLFCYIIFTVYKAVRTEEERIVKYAKIVLACSVLLCFALFVGIDIFTGFTENYNFDIIRLFGVVGVIASSLWYMTISEKDVTDNKTYHIDKFGPAQVFVVLLLVADISLLFFSKNEGAIQLYRVTNFSNVAFMVIVFLFLSSQQNQKITLNKLNTKLILLDQQKNQFLSFATHQLKAPLTAMKWGMETLREMGYTKAEQPQRSAIVDKLYSTTDDLIHTVGDFLDISKIEQGGLVLKKEGFLWAEYVATLAAEFKGASVNKGLDLVIDVPNLNEMVFADKTKLRQVVVNLIDNAIKYTPTGKITVKVEKKGVLLHTMVSR